MATANEKIRDALIRHQVDVLRFSDGLASRLVRLFNKAEPELRAMIKARTERLVRTGRDRGPTVTKRVNAIRDTYAEIMVPTWQTIRGTTRRELVELGVIEGEFVAGTTAAALPVIVDLNVPSPTEIRKILTQTPITGQLLSKWLASWETNDRSRAIEQVRIGLIQGETPTQISRRIFGRRNVGGVDGVREVSRRGAGLLAHTAASMISNETKREIYKNNADVIKRELFVATLDSRTTPICQSLDGNRYPVDEGPYPPIHPRCRSTRAPAFDGDDLFERPASTATARTLGPLRGKERRARVAELTGPVPGRTTYQEFLTNAPASFQNEVLGPTRAKLFRAGELDVDNFVDFTGRRYTIDELRDRLPRSVFDKAGV